MSKFHSFKRVPLVIFALVFFSAFFFFGSKIVSAWGCVAADKNVWFDSTCPGASPSNPTGGSEVWKDFAGDVWGGGTACAIGASSQWHPHQDGVGYYQYEYVCVEWKERRDTRYCVNYSWVCIPKYDIVWKGIEVDKWPSVAKEGDYCKARYPVFGNLNPCAGQWGYWKETGEYGRWDPDDNGCVRCSNNKQIEIYYCAKGSKPVADECEEACGAHPDCDELNPGDPLAEPKRYGPWECEGACKRKRPVYKCDSNCQKFTDYQYQNAEKGKHCVNGEFVPGVCNNEWKCSVPQDDNYGTGGDYLCQGYCDDNGNCDYAGNCLNCNLLDGVYPDNLDMITHPKCFDYKYYSSYSSLKQYRDYRCSNDKCVCSVGLDSSIVTAAVKCVDINRDGTINIVDIAIIAKAFGSYPGHPKWKDEADLDESGLVNIIDIARVAKAFGMGTDGCWPRG